LLHRIIQIAAFLLLGACAAPKYNYSPQSLAVSFPEIGETRTVGIGEEMLRQGDYSEIAMVRLTRPATVGAFGAYTFSEGYYRKVGEDAESEFFLPASDDQGGHVQRAALADPFEAMQIMRADGSLCGVSVYGGKACTDSWAYERENLPSLSASNFQQTLIYSGKVGNVIKLGYREFAGNAARQAFSNDVQYDLREGREIGYKGARLEILKATNRSISYRVLQNFNAAR
jgi:hypothetical protein